VEHKSAIAQRGPLRVKSAVAWWSGFVNVCGCRPWLTQLLARKPAKVAAVALANKMARVAWAVLTKKEIYRVRPITATSVGD
jgi:transposase